MGDRRNEDVPACESGLIGAVVYDSQRCYPDIVDGGVRAQWFSDPCARFVWEAIERLWQEELPVDIMMVENTIKKKGDFFDNYDRDIRTFVSACVDSAMPEHIGGYIAEARESWQKRGMTETFADGINRLQKGANPSKVTADVMERIAELDRDDRSLPDKQESKRRIVARWKDVFAGKKLGVPTPWRSFNEQTGGPRYGQVTVLASRKGFGKSCLVANWLHGLGIGESSPPAVMFALEDGADQTWSRLAAIHGKISTFRCDVGRADVAHIENATAALDDVMKLPIYVDGRRGMTVDEFRRQVHVYVKRYGVRVVFLDGFKDLKRTSDNDVAEDNYMSNGLCNVAERLDIAIIVVHHVIKPTVVDKQGHVQAESGRIGLRDIRGSGRIVDDARMVLILQKLGDTEYELDCAAANHAPTCKIPLRFEPDVHRFVEEETEEPAHEGGYRHGDDDGK